MRIGLDFPQRYYPRSFLSLLLLAFALVAAPLVVAFYNAAVYVEQLAGQSQTAVSQAAQASRGSRLLVEQTTALERVVRQYLILDDEELLNDYARLRANFKANTSELSLQPLDEPQLHELNNTIDKEQGLYEQLLGKPKTAADKKALVEGYVVRRSDRGGEGPWDRWSGSTSARRTRSSPRCARGARRSCRTGAAGG